jgi:hypothetical protein
MPPTRMLVKTKSAPSTAAARDAHGVTVAAPAYSRASAAIAGKRAWSES